MDNLIEDLGLTCCFCNKSIEQTDTDPCDISITTNWGKSDKQYNQFFWCHLKCFKEYLHKDIRAHCALDVLCSDE